MLLCPLTDDLSVFFTYINFCFINIKVLDVQFVETKLSYIVVCFYNWILYSFQTFFCIYYTSCVGKL